MLEASGRFEDTFPVREGEILSFAEFVSRALYDPENGYYRRLGPRVGTGRGTDFYTNLAFRSVLAPLVIAAVTNGLPLPPNRYSFVEIGAEPEGGLIRPGEAHPFKEVILYGIGERIEIPDPAVVFSNEWLDALPFCRFRFHGDIWYEIGVTRNAEGRLAEVTFPFASASLERIRSDLPRNVQSGYTLDVSLEAEDQVARLLVPNWTGRWVAFDYGHSWERLLSDFPEGTGRAYWNHRQSGDLLQRPGKQDLTASVCWDRIANVLIAGGCQTPRLYRQEEYFMKCAAGAVARIVSDGPAGYRPERSKLLSLLHPGQMGACFQVMVADRFPPSIPE